MEDLDGIGRQGQQALFIAFAEDPDLRIGQLEIFESEIEGLTGAQTVQQHQGDQGEVPRGTKAVPKLGDLIAGERHNDALSGYLTAHGFDVIAAEGMDVPFKQLQNVPPADIHM